MGPPGAVERAGCRRPPIAGDSSFDQGTFTIDASGADIWGQSDQFHFVYQQVTGDVDMIARVDSVVDDRRVGQGRHHDQVVAGCRCRARVCVRNGGNGTAFQSRAQDAGASAHVAGPATAAPAWVRLMRTGTKVTAFSSSDGATWSTIGSATIALGSDAYIGLAVTSHNLAAATTAAISQVAVVSSSLPAGQKAVDIGSPAIAGSVTYRQGVYTQHAAGVDIWGSADQFNFVYQPVTGDVEIVARVASIANTATRPSQG